MSAADGHYCFRTIWISDVHLGSSACQAYQLLEFLRAHKANTLYLVGDILDAWQLRRNWYWPQAHNDVVQKILRSARKGTQVVYVPGNHDELVRKRLRGRPAGQPPTPTRICSQSHHRAVFGARRYFTQSTAVHENQTMLADLAIVPAKEESLDAINALIARSKAYWTWPTGYLEQALVLQRVDADYLRGHHSFEILYRKNELVGFFAVAPNDNRVVLDNLWVAPERIGRGIGKRACVCVPARERSQLDRALGGS